MAQCLLKQQVNVITFVVLKAGLISLALRTYTCSRSYGKLAGDQAGYEMNIWLFKKL